MADTKNYTEFLEKTSEAQNDLHLIWDTAAGRSKKITVANKQQSPTEYYSFNTAPAAPPTSEGKIYWDAADHTLVCTTNFTDVALQVGQEMQISGTNKSGVNILNGEVVYVSGAQGNRPTFTKAKADKNSTINVIGIATHDINDNANGLVTAFGLVRGLDTSSFIAGDALYVSPTTAGGLTKTRPEHPNYSLFVGTVLTVNPSVGVIFVHPESFQTSVNTLVANSANGYIVENINLAVTSDGATITASLSAASGSMLSFIFSDGVTDVDVSTPMTVTVTPAGADTTPAERWLYVLASDPTTLVESLTGFPTAEHAKIARLIVQTATGVQTNKPLKQHNYTNAVADGNQQGELDYITDWIRKQHATWLSGTALSVSGTGTGTINIATTSGVVSQVHNHTFEAKTSPATVFVVNDFATSYKTITNLGAGITTDSAGNTLTNKWYTLVLWGVASQGGVGADHLMINVPSGSYNTLTEVNNDAMGYADTSIPAEFKGTGFLIAKIVLKNVAGTTWTYDNTGNNDLRGFFPNTDAGSASGAATTFSDSTFQIFNAADDSKILDYDVSGVTTATTRTWTVQDIDMTPIGQNGAVINALTSTINNVVDPSAAQDAATKNYVDTHSTNGIWDRTGTTISPANAGDDLSLGAGDFTLTGNIAANGGTLTSTTAFDINPSGNFSVTLGGSEQFVANMGVGDALFTSSSEFKLALKTDVVGTGEVDLEFQKTRSNGVITSGDALGRINFSGHDGTSISEGASIRTFTTGTISAGQVPTYISFYTNTTAGSITEKLRINADGLVEVKAGNLTVSGTVKTGTTTIEPLVSAAGATPVDSDVSSWANDSFGIIVGTGGRIFHAYKNATDVYYVELTAL